MAFYEACLANYDELLAVQEASLQAVGTVVIAAASEQTSGFIEAFRQPQAGDLPAHFMPPAPEVNPFSAPETIKALANPRTEAQLVLSRLPFVDNADIDWRQAWDKRRLVIEGDLLVPAERIISVRSFKDWQTGLNSPVNPTRIYSPDALGLGPGSLNAMITYAALPRETQPKNDGSVLVITRDADGEYWGVLDCDGSHRAGSQKLRGDSYIQIAKTVVYDDEAMPQISYGVRDRHSSY